MCKQSASPKEWKKTPHSHGLSPKSSGEEREKKGLTQGQLAGLSGLSETYISFIEHAHTKLSVNALVHIAAVFSLEASEAMRRIEKENEKRPAASEEADGPSEEKTPDSCNAHARYSFLSHP